MAHQPGPSHSTAELVDRLRSLDFVGQDAVDAIHGKRLPANLGRHLTRYCVVRGIRHHLRFATGEAAALEGLLPMFTAAIHARLIMSNLIPEIQDKQDMPYCIWYPDVPSEETLRQLAQKYPEMRYQVGRACAVAGYTTLYESLDILPEVAIAEEARESGSTEIYQLIMQQSVKWKVFDDYTCSLGNPIPSCLNGDTTVVGELQHTQGFCKPKGLTSEEMKELGPESDENDTGIDFWDEAYGYGPIRSNITGDMLLDAPEKWEDLRAFEPKDRPTWPKIQASNETLELFWSPLPSDLPTLDKDVLIFMAAYHGNVDRYSRLRRPYVVFGEREAVVRGIYHNTLFARWWSTQPPVKTTDGSRIAAAIIARFIMNDDISWATDQSRLGGWPITFPSLIHYPEVASAQTYEALARAVPEMRLAVARAAIYANFPKLFDLVILGVDANFDPVSPDQTLHNEAKYSSNPYYRQTLDSICGKKNISTGDLLGPGAYNVKPWQLVSLRDPASFSRSSRLNVAITSWLELIDFNSGMDWETEIYNGAYCNAGRLERFISLPSDWKPTPEDVDSDTDEIYIDYKSWPQRFAGHGK